MASFMAWRTASSVGRFPNTVGSPTVQQKNKKNMLELASSLKKHRLRKNKIRHFQEDEKIRWYLWIARSWACLGSAWASCCPRWPWWDWTCCWPSQRASRPTPAGGFCPWQGTNCHLRWQGERHSQRLPSHSGLCSLLGFFQGLHFHSSEPSKRCCPS